MESNIFIYSNDKCDQGNPENKYQIVDIYRDFDLLTGNEYLQQLHYQFFQYMMSSKKGIQAISDISNKVLHTLDSYNSICNYQVTTLFKIQHVQEYLQPKPLNYSEHQQNSARKHLLDGLLKQLFEERNNKITLSYQGTMVLLLGLYGDKSINWAEYFDAESTWFPCFQYVHDTRNPDVMSNNVLTRLSNLFINTYEKSNKTILIKRVIWQQGLVETIHKFIKQIEKQMTLIYQNNENYKVLNSQFGISFDKLIEDDQQILNRFVQMYGKFNNYSIHVIVEMIVEVLSYFVNNNFNVGYLDTITFDIDEVIKYHSQANPNKDTRDVLKQYKPEKNTIQLIQSGYMLNPALYMNK